ncbi:Chromatin structure remodeling complex protein sfh1 [Linderina macrospora]|uniref:Chromatin structure remodeling complex protein sfh1 n=1 Tax=Linderina macrospora TaxID=4868 RepID=A0ACC1J331_9FUNG|nr:Chromatin structure remodeling complex protein sfh1 [Linderina macrospora]
MLVLSASANTTGAGNGTGSVHGGMMTSSGRLTRTRSTRGSRRNLREWSSDSENEYGAEDDAESMFETDGGSPKNDSESRDGRSQEAEPMSGVGVQPAYDTMQKRARRRTAHWHLRDDQAKWVAQQDELLVPIRIELEVGDFRLHDVFVWNAKEPIVTPEHFAAIYCADIALPADGKASAQIHIAQLIRQQVAEYVTVDSADVSASELRVMLNLEIQIGAHVLRDRVEWDILEPLGAKPEEFAKSLCRDLGLGGEYPPLVAHRVREEIARLQKELAEVGDAHWLRQHPIDSAFRPAEMANAWGPSVEILSAEELDRMWMHKERSYRRMRRSERGHIRSFNFLPPEALPHEPGVAPTVLAPSINPAYYAQAALSTSAVDAALAPHTTASPNGRRSHHSTIRIQTGTSTSQQGTPSRVSTPRQHTRVDLSNWECQHCGCDSSGTPIPRQGPNGPKTLCNACGIAWMVRNRQELPSHRKDMYRNKH